MLLGYLYRPAGNGPFPAILFQHGNHKSLTTLSPSLYQPLADFFTSRGYLVFIPDRQILAIDKTQYSAALQAKLDTAPDAPATRDAQMVERMEIIGRDVVASVRWLIQQPDVNTNRVAMIGWFSGAVQALLAAPKDLPIRSYVSFSPGVTTWKEGISYQKMLVDAVRKAKAPIFLVFTENNQSLTPAEVLGREVMAKGKVNRSKIFPAYGKQGEYGRLFLENGEAIWGSDVLSFLEQTMNN